MLPEHKQSSVLLQEWEGYVSSVGTTSFEAILIDMTAPGGPEELAEIPLSHLSAEDRVSIAEGVLVRLQIGHAGIPEEARLEVRLVRQVWDPAELEQARQKAAELARDLFAH